MRLVIPQWQGRVSPVLDVAGNLEVVDRQESGIISRWSVDVAAGGIQDRVRRIADLGVDVVICGAVSRALEAALESEGVAVIPQTRGDIEEVAEAFWEGRLNEECFLMPGCDGRRRFSRDAKTETGKNPGGGRSDAGGRREEAP